MCSTLKCKLYANTEQTSTCNHGTQLLITLCSFRMQRTIVLCKILNESLTANCAFDRNSASHII